jgi:hypothetical protein
MTINRLFAKVTPLASVLVIAVFGNDKALTGRRVTQS